MIETQAHIHRDICISNKYININIIITIITTTTN